MTPTRLCLAELESIAPSQRPRLDPRQLQVGILHLGLGAFHRAHQAVYTEDAVAAAGGSWGICGVSERSPRVADCLRAQDGLYSVITRADEGSSIRVMGSVRQVMFAQENPDALVGLMADPSIAVVTSTVTEKGYRLNPATGRLRGDDPEVGADGAGRPPRTVPGQLGWGIVERWRRRSGPLSLVCCDNLRHNGGTLRQVVLDFCSLLAPGERRGLEGWIEENVSFPSTMVDRIVPATGSQDLIEAQSLLGVDDRGVVVAEPFSQWVIEDSFPAGRPAWERAGATLTADVEPYEVAKLRVVNGAHSALAYLGSLAGLHLVSEAVRDERLARYLELLLDQDVIPTLSVPPGWDLDAYARSVAARFANRAIHHRTAQVAADGSQKLPVRLLGTIRDRLQAGAEPRWAALAVAAWMRYVSARRSDPGEELPVDDPLAGALEARLAGAVTPAEIVDRLLGLRAIFPPELADSEVLRHLLVDHLAHLGRFGTWATVEAETAGA